MARKKYGDRVREVTNTEGSSDFHLNGVTDPLENTFVGEIHDGEWCDYCCEDLNDWEIGYGQVHADPDGLGYDVLTRDIIYASSNGGLKVPFTVGDKTIYNTPTAKALDHIAGFVINDSDISFNRSKFVAIEAQDTFDFIYMRGSLEVRVDGLVFTEDQYEATDGETVILDVPLTAGQVVECMSIGQYTTTHSELSTPVPVGQLFKSDIFLNDLWRNSEGIVDGLAANCVRAAGTSGVAGDGVSFNGTTSTITFIDFGLDHATPFTIAFWMQTASTLADAVLLANQSVDDTDGYLLIKTTAGGSLTVAVLDASSAEQVITKTIAASTLYHVVLTYDGSDLTLWVDGVEETPLTTTVKATTPTLDLSLGYKLWPTPASYCEAELSGVNVYDVLLSDEDIALIYSEPDAPDVTTLGAIVVPSGSVATNDDIIAMVIALG